MTKHVVRCKQTGEALAMRLSGGYCVCATECNVNGGSINPPDHEPDMEAKTFHETYLEAWHQHQEAHRR